MKKFLLPLAALMLGSVAMQAETVQLSYYATGYGDPYPDMNNLFASAENELLRNGDGTFTLKNWQNSGCDITFKPGEEKEVTMDGPTKGLYMIDILSPTLSGTGRQTIPSYKFNMRTSDKFYNPYDKSPIANFDATGSLYITPGASAVAETEVTDTEITYKVSLSTYWYFKTADGSRRYIDGWCFFNYSVEKEKTEEPEQPDGSVTISYYTNTNQPPVSTGKYQIDETSENQFTIKNFLNSGFDIPFVVSDIVKKEETFKGKQCYAMATLSFAPEYVKNQSPYTLQVKLPDNAIFTAKLQDYPGYENCVDPKFYHGVTYSWVRYFKDGSQTRVLHHLYGFNNGKNLNVEWETYMDGMVDVESGIEDVVVDENAPVEWFNLQGVRVNADNLTPGIYVKRQGSKTVKVLVK